MKRIVFIAILAFAAIRPIFSFAQFGVFTPAQVDPNLINSLVETLSKKYDVATENLATPIYLNCAKFKNIKLARLVYPTLVSGCYIAFIFDVEPNLHLRLRFYKQNKKFTTESGAYTFTTEGSYFVIRRNFIPSSSNNDEYLYYLKTEGEVQQFPCLYADLNQTTPGVGTTNPIGGSTSSSVQTVTCSLCNGRGWIAGCSSPTYGNGGTSYCSACQRNVPASHSHDRCPSCGGTGKITKIR